MSLRVCLYIGSGPGFAGIGKHLDLGIYFGTVARDGCLNTSLGTSFISKHLVAVISQPDTSWNLLSLLKIVIQT